MSPAFRRLPRRVFGKQESRPAGKRAEVEVKPAGTSRDDIGRGGCQRAKHAAAMGAARKARGQAPYGRRVPVLEGTDPAGSFMGLSGLKNVSGARAVDNFKIE
jgi:hypothetical protein